MSSLLKISEQSIVNVIIQWLSINHFNFVHVRNSGTIFHKNGQTFFGRNKFNQRGAPDLLFSYHGIPIACEVKSKKGVVRPEQIEWLKKWEAAPNLGRSVIVRSLDELMTFLDFISQDIIPKSSHLENISLQQMQRRT